MFFELMDYSFKKALLYRFQLNNQLFFNYWNENRLLDEKLNSNNIDLNNYTKKKLELDKKYDYRNNKTLLINLYNIEIKDHIYTNEEADEICKKKFSWLIWSKVKKFYYENRNNEDVIFKRLNIGKDYKEDKSEYGLYSTREW